MGCPPSLLSFSWEESEIQCLARRGEKRDQSTPASRACLYAKNFIHSDLCSYKIRPADGIRIGEKMKIHSHSGYGLVRIVSVCTLSGRAYFLHDQTNVHVGRDTNPAISHRLSRSGCHKAFECLLPVSWQPFCIPWVEDWSNTRGSNRGRHRTTQE